MLRKNDVAENLGLPHTRVVLPEKVEENMAGIIDAVVDATFSEIANQLNSLGYPVSGDFTPGEVFETEYIIWGFVNSMALNNIRIGEMQDDSESYDDTAAEDKPPLTDAQKVEIYGVAVPGMVYRVTEIEACAPEELKPSNDVRVLRHPKLSVGGWDRVTIIGETRSAVVEYVRENWGDSDPDWFNEYIVGRVEQVSADWYDEEPDVEPTDLGEWVVTTTPDDPSLNPMWVGNARDALDAFDQFADVQGFARYSDCIADPNEDNAGLVGKTADQDIDWAIFTNFTVYALPVDQGTKKDAEIAMNQPTVYLVIGPSAITRDERGEIVETVEWTAKGKPDWSEAGICDRRGAGGTEGFRVLHRALDAAEANARMIGAHVKRVK